MDKPKFSVGDEAMQAWNRVRVTEHKVERRTNRYKVQRLVPEPVGFNSDGTIATSAGYPFWVDEWQLQPVPK